MTELRIRRAVVADAEDILALREEAARWLTGRGIDQWHPGEISADDVLGWLAGGRVYVAEQLRLTPAIVGSVRLAWTDEPVWGEQAAEAGYVQALMSARSVAGHGVGRQLLRHVEQVTARSGRTATRLSCLRGNAGLEGFYRRAGYAEVGDRSFATPGWEPVTLFEKALGPAAVS